ncbi:MAG TPA: peroxiredoxin [Candidatus Binatia bacterium]|nr:peroxiredoxin [Candidatus Binatia bacterium]
MTRLTAAAVFLLATMATPPCAHSAQMLQEGQQMPSFELVDHEGRTVRSSDLAGKRYLLWFYPKAMTPGCTVEAQGLRDNHAGLDKAGVIVLGVSFDDPAENKRFVEAESLPFRLLSDKDRKLAVAVGAADAADAGTARRISYLVGPDGKVVKAYASVEPGTHAAQVLADCGGGTT